MEINFPKIEQEILEFWQKEKIFEKSVEKRQKPKKILGIFPRKPKNFVFFEGPPTANAKPGIHHVLARIFKDIICRYKTMRGFAVLRKAGWDTHGLPVELEIEKKLGFKSKQDIEKYGIAKFNEECKKSVWQYKQDWEKLTERIGFWLDMERPYITYENNYIETLWWEIKKIWQKGLLFQDYKVVPYCPRCQTTLSGHEVAQGYKKIKEPAIYIKLKIKENKNLKSLPTDSEVRSRNLLVWTTTPWTLPANVAVAVNPKFEYVEAQIGFETFILAKERTVVLDEVKILREFGGRELVGLEYEPLYLTCDPQVYASAFQIIEGDFVNTKEGTGLVHIAPAFGEDDMNAIRKQNEKTRNGQKKIPILMTVDETGKFTGEVRKFSGMFVKDADPLIIQDLRERGVLYKEESYEHDYPFCWRCNAPLLYYAKKSWFIGTKKIKDDLIKNNQKINWVPDYLKEGRFGEWLRELKDWAVSRERYWGTPLPVWQCRKCRHIEVIGSKRNLLFQKFSKNRYILLRHGYSVMNEKKIVISTLPEIIECPLAQKGEEQIRKIAPILKKEKIDLIFSSDLLRTTQTAQIVANGLGISSINFDARLRDIQMGIFEGKELKEHLSFWKNMDERFVKSPEGGENYNEVKLRVYNFLKEIDRRYEGKTILIVSHQRVLSMLEGAVKGLSREEFLEKIEPNQLHTGEFKKIEFKEFPYNGEGELDFHRPFIDELEFYCQKCGEKMGRVSEVLDCWFDSGSMPFAQWHWPFILNQKSKIKNQKFKLQDQFPADYISEAVDQTRGWFYTLLAVSTLLGFKGPYKNVISLGHVLDKKGEKMSKSRGNAVDPGGVIDKYGADVLRWYFFTINQPGDSKRFDEESLRDCLNKFILTFWNTFVFFETYVKKIESPIPEDAKKFKPKTLLDKWVVSKLSQLIKGVTKNLENYDIISAARAIERFAIEDFSNWYIRRSRHRFHLSSEQELIKNKKVKDDFLSARQTLRYALSNLSRLCAPFIPFLSETLYQGLATRIYADNSVDLRGKIFESVHLEDWPKANKDFVKPILEKQMEIVRKICSFGLEMRAKAGIKVRQPLQNLKIKHKKLKTNKELLNLIKDELNIKSVEVIEKITDEIKMNKNWLIEEGGGITLAINSEISQELKEEGFTREFIRRIQEFRKKLGLTPKNQIIIRYKGLADLENIIEKNQDLIKQKTLAREMVKLEEGSLKGEEIEVEKEKMSLAIDPVRNSR